MKRLILTTALAAVLPLAAANAGLVLDESINGGTSFTQLCGGAVACSPGIVFTDPNGVVFTILGASSNSPGTPTGADVTQASVRVTNTTGATHSLILRAGDTGFTAPSGAVTLSNQISGTVVTGNAANLFSSMACANPADVQNGCASPADVTPTINSNITQSNSAGSNFNSLGIASLGTPFSLTEVVSMTLGNGTVLTYTGSADVMPVPEPATLGMLLVGMVGMTGLVELRRRRRR